MQSVSRASQPGPSNDLKSVQKDQKVAEYFDENASVKRIQISGKLKMKGDPESRSMGGGFGWFWYIHKSSFKSSGQRDGIQK